MKYSNYLLLFIVTIVSIGCTQKRFDDDISEWDFDHHVRFEQKKLSDNRFYIKVHRFDNTHFPQLATFLLRQSFKVCQGYGYTIEVLDGVEAFDDKKARPNWIPPSLAANVECLSK
ncbi:hypothetical protein [Thalassotalea ganghwensis]